MTDQELVDKVVVLGIVKAQSMAWHLLDSDGDVIAVFTQERLLLCDWRAAGALMERLFADTGIILNICEYKAMFEITHLDEREDEHLIKNESLPRAIIEACVEALS